MRVRGDRTRRKTSQRPEPPQRDPCSRDDEQPSAVRRRPDCHPDGRIRGVVASRVLDQAASSPCMRSTGVSQPSVLRGGSPARRRRPPGVPGPTVRAPEERCTLCAITWHRLIGCQKLTNGRMRTPPKGGVLLEIRRLGRDQSTLHARGIPAARPAVGRDGQHAGAQAQPGRWSGIMPLRRLPADSGRRPAGPGRPRRRRRSRGRPRTRGAVSPRAGPGCTAASRHWPARRVPRR